MQDHLNLLKIVKGDIFVFADVSSSIQSDNSKNLSLRPQLEKDEWDDYCNKINDAFHTVNGEQKIENIFNEISKVILNHKSNL